MDIIDRHLTAENAQDVQGTLATYTDHMTMAMTHLKPASLPGWPAAHDD